MRLLFFLLLVMAFAAPGLAQKANLTPGDIQLAIEKGTKEKKKVHALYLEQVEFGLTTGFRVAVFTPTTWLQTKAAEAATQYKELKVDEVTEEMIAPVLRVIAYPNMPENIRHDGDSCEHVVLRDLSKTKVLQPKSKEPFAENAQNAMGAQVSYNGIIAVFELSGLAEIQANSREFLITVVGSQTEKDFKVKEKHFKDLP